MNITELLNRRCYGLDGDNRGKGIPLHGDAFYPKLVLSMGITETGTGRDIRRRVKRFPVNLNSVIISNFRGYLGFIDNVSEEGLAYVRVERETFGLTLREFTPQKRVELIVVVPEGETVSLECQVKWMSMLTATRDFVPEYPTLTIGMKIIDPPLRYREFVRTL